MKKYLAVLMAMLFVLGLASAAFAIHAEIPAETQAVVAKGSTIVTIGGDLRFRGVYRDNTSDQNSDTEDDDAYIDQRVRLKFDVKVSDNTNARIHIEHGNTWGEGIANNANDNAKGTYNKGNYVETDTFDFVEAWINHNFGPVGIKVGHMPLALGNLLFFDHRKEGDDAIVLYGSSNNIHWAALATKFREGNKAQEDDVNAYVVLANYKGDGFSLGGDITYLDDQTGDLPATNNVQINADNLNLVNIGVRGEIAVSGITLKGDVEFQTGTIKDVAGTDVDLSGYAAMVSAAYTAGNTNLELKVAYGSGDDASTADEVEAFQTSLSAVQYDTFIYGYMSGDTAGGNGAGQTGISNLMMVALKASNKVSKNLKVDGGIYWLQAAEDVSINGGPADSDLGIEIDAKVTYNLDRNLKYWVEAGYFMVGDAYNDANGNADDMFAIRHGIQLSF